MLVNVEHLNAYLRDLGYIMNMTVITQQITFSNHLKKKLVVFVPPTGCDVWKCLFFLAADWTVLVLNSARAIRNPVCK